MFARIVTFVAVTTIVLLSNLSTANGAPIPDGEPNVVLNRQLAEMALAPAPRSVPPSVFVGLSPRTAVDQQRKTDWLSNPTFLAIAGRFTTAERFMHYRHGGIDANFWGLLNRGHGIRIQFSTRL